MRETEKIADEAPAARFAGPAQLGEWSFSGFELLRTDLIERENRSDPRRREVVARGCFRLLRPIRGRAVELRRNWNQAITKLELNRLTKSRVQSSREPSSSARSTSKLEEQQQSPP